MLPSNTLGVSFLKGCQVLEVSVPLSISSICHDAKSFCEAPIAT